MNELTKQEPTTGLSIYDRIADPIQAAEKLGDWFCRSGLFGCDKTEQGNMLALVCLTERKSPTEITRNYDIVQGRLRKKSMALHADFRARGGTIRWINTGDDGQEAKADFAFEGQTVTLSYSIESAKKAGLVKPKSAWETNPGNMLRARLLSNGIGMLCPEILAGETDEVEHAPAAPAVSLNLAKEDPKPANVEPLPKAEPPTKPEPQVVDVEAEPEPQPETKQETMSADLWASLTGTLKEHNVDLEKARIFALSKGWINDTQDLTDLPEKTVRQILSRTASFARAVAKIEGGDQ